MFLVYFYKSTLVHKITESRTMMTEDAISWFHIYSRNSEETLRHDLKDLSGVYSGSRSQEGG